jgi:hypothetical protein
MTATVVENRTNINQPSMLMTILNIEQARSSNVKRDQPNPKFASNWHFIEFLKRRSKINICYDRQ